MAQDSALVMEITASEPTSPNVELCTLIQEKRKLAFSPAGFTCDKCPQPLKSFTMSIGLYEPQKAWYRLDMPEGGMTFYPSGHHTTCWTKRCKECNTKITRWSRNNRLIKFVQDVSDIGLGVCMAFTTLTRPNHEWDGDEEKLRDDLLDFKKEITKFLRTKNMKEKVLGGFNFFEQTYSKENGINSHCHGIWIMADYYDQKQLSKDFRGRCDIRKIKSKKKMIRYATKYSSKGHIHDIRTKESFGVCRGSARTALELELAQMRDAQNSVRDAFANLDLADCQDFNLDVYEWD